MHGRQEHDTARADREQRHIRRLLPRNESPARRSREAGASHPIGADQTLDRTPTGPARPDTSSPLITRTTLYDDLPEWLRVSELATYWAVSVDTVYAMIARGELRPCYMGRIARIPKEQARRPEGRGKK